MQSYYENEMEAFCKTATVQYKPVTILAGNHNALVHYEQSHVYDQTSHVLSNIYGLYGWSFNLLDVISVCSLNLGLFTWLFLLQMTWVHGYRTLDIHKTRILDCNCKKTCSHV